MSQLPSRISDSPFERPTLSFANLLRGDIEGAALGLISPGSLSPKQRRTLADEFGVGQGNTLYDFAIRAITNPVVLVGAILTLRYPIAHAGEMLKYAKHLTGVNKKVGLIMRSVGGVDEIFHGVKAHGAKATLPEDYKGLLRSVEEFRRTHADKVAQAIIRAEDSGFQFDLKNQILVSAKLDGLDQGKKAIFRSLDLGKAGNTLVKDVRSGLDDLYKQVMGDIQKRNILLDKRSSDLVWARAKAAKAGDVEYLAATKKTSRVLAGLKGANTRALTDQLEASGFDRATIIKLVKASEREHKVVNYFPRKVPLTEELFKKQTAAMLETSALREKGYGFQSERAATLVSTPHVEARTGGMIPEIRDLLHVENYLKPGQADRLRQVIQKNADDVARGAIVKSGPRKGKLIEELNQYSLRFMPVMSSYIHSLGRAYGWTIKGYGEKIVQATKALEVAGDLPRAAMMRDSYIPLALGRSTFRQAMANLKWSQWRVDLSEKLIGNKRLNIEPAKWAKHVPPGMKAWLSNALVEDRGLLSLKNISGRSAGYLYLSALGGNPVSASYNLMQLMLTTVPVIGPRWTMKGLQETFRKAPKYFKARALKGGTHESALRAAYPEFAESGLVSAPLAEEAISKSLNQAWEVTLSTQGKWSKKTEPVKQAMMAMFQTSESIVRLASFEGARAKALADGLSKTESLFFGRRVTEMTQYLSGPANVPGMMKEWNPLLRQFGHFPARTVEFLLGPATKLGSASQTGFGGRNWGTLGRAALTSGLAYEAGQELFDRDLSHGLMFGALPIPSERQVFFPVPFMPPAVSIAGGAVADVIKGEFEYSKYSLPLLIPGGLGLARASTAYAPDLAKVLGRGYADYANRTQDGRVPVYTSKGSLRGYMSDFQLFTEALGVGGGDPTGQKEKELQGYLVQQRDRIRQFRREFLDALTDNETEKASTIQAEFEQTYPGMGGLQVKETDLRAVHRRKQIPRIELMLDTLPAEARGPMGQMIAMVLAGEADEFLGVDPYLLQVLPTAAKRDPYREEQPQSIMQELWLKQVLARQIPRQAQAGGSPFMQQAQSRHGRQTGARIEGTPSTWATGGFSPF